MQKMLGRKHILALDIGGTIEDTWSAKQNWFRKKGIDIGQKSIGRSEIEALLGKNKAMYQEMVDEVYSEEGIMSHKLVKDSRKIIEIIHANFEIFLLSTRQENMRRATVNWLNCNGIMEFVSDIVFTYDHRHISCIKLKTCYRLGGELIIDDDIRHLTPASEFPSIKKFLLTQNAISVAGINIFQGWETLPVILGGMFQFEEN